MNCRHDLDAARHSGTPQGAAGGIGARISRLGLRLRCTWRNEISFHAEDHGWRGGFVGAHVRCAFGAFAEVWDDERLAAAGAVFG